MSHHQIDTGPHDTDGYVWIIRPDGHVASRVTPTDVDHAIDRILDRAHDPSTS